MRSRSIALAGLLGILVVQAGCVPVLPSQVCAGRTCTGGFVCDPGSGRCVPPTAIKPGGACVADAECGASTPRCDTGSSVCVECLDDVDCSGGTCSQQACVRIPDSCSTVGAGLDLSAGPITVEGDTTHATSDVTLSCAQPGASARDVVYAVTIPARKRLVAVATPTAGSGLLPVLGLRSTCGSAAAVDQLGCATPSLGTTSTRLVVDPVLPGTVYLWVDGESGTEGEFTLNLSLEDTTAGESCSVPIYLALNKASLTVMGDTSTMADDAAGTCGGSGGNDALYVVQLSTAKRVAFEVTTTTGSYSPVLYLRTTCDDGAAQKQLACVGTFSPAGPKIELPRLEPGSYYLWVDGQSGKSGSYTLKIDTSDPLPPPTNDTCATAEVIAVPAGGVGTVVRQSDTGQAKGDALGCGATGNDLAYTFTTTAAVGLEAKVTPFPGSPLKPVVYLRGGAACASEAAVDQFSCAQASTVGGATTLAIPFLPPGTWALWVDGAAGSAGPFELRLDFKAAAPAPSNDTCAMPASIALAGAPVTLLGTTWGATDQHTGCEVPLGSFSPDVAYSLVVNARQSIGIELKAEPGSTLKPVLSLLSPGTCGSNSIFDLKGCGWGDPQLTDRLLTTIPVIDPGVYPMWIEGDDGSLGQFSLRLSPGPALEVPPVNDDCLTATVLQSGTSVAGDTRAAANDAEGSCGLPGGANGEYGRDVVYRLTLASAQTVNLTVTPDATEGLLFRPVMYVQGPGTASCNGGGAVKGCQIAQSYGGAASLSLPNLAAGVYFVWVDGAGLSGGKFTIRWQ